MDNKVLILLVAVLAMSGAVFTLVPTDDGGSDSPTPSPTPTPVDPDQQFMESLHIARYAEYLYSATYTSYDYEKGLESMDKYAVNAACSSVWNNGIVGRNYDWYYDETAEFVLSVPATEGRHASLGVASGMVLTDRTVSEGKYDDIYRVLPFYTMDGINDCGVECNINVVSYGDHGLTKGTNPGAKDLCLLMAPRYVLDFADSAQHAVKLLSDMNLYPPHKQEVELHVMISDLKQSFVLEIVDNKLVILENETIMTNFYLSDVRGLEYGSEKYFEALTLHPMGYERYGILHNGYASADNVKGMIALMRSVFYTHTYGIDGGKIWYSELYADYTSFGYGDFTKISNVDDFKPIIDYSMEHFKTHLRDRTSWQTVHSSIYDLKEGKLFITVQETDRIFEFALGAT